MDRRRNREVATSSREEKKVDLPWASREFKKTGQLTKSDWQSLENKLLAIQDPNTSKTVKEKKLQEYQRDLDNYSQNAMDPIWPYVSTLVEYLPESINDDRNINGSFELVEQYRKTSDS